MKNVKELEKEKELAEEIAQASMYEFVDSDATTDDEEFKLLVENLLKLRECRRNYFNQLYNLNN